MVNLTLGSIFRMNVLQCIHVEVNFVNIKSFPFDHIIGNVWNLPPPSLMNISNYISFWVQFTSFSFNPHLSPIPLQKKQTNWFGNGGFTLNNNRPTNILIEGRGLGFCVQTYCFLVSQVIFLLHKNLHGTYRGKRQN